MGSLSGRILVGVLVPALAVWGRWRLRNAGRRLSGGWRGERQRSSCGTDGGFGRTAWRSRRRPSCGGRPERDPAFGVPGGRGGHLLSGAGPGRSGGSRPGCVVGAAAGAVYLAVVVAPECEAELVPLCVGFLAAYGAILGAPVGIVGGLFIGAVRGSQICVRFASDGSQ